MTEINKSGENKTNDEEKLDSLVKLFDKPTDIKQVNSQEIEVDEPTSLNLGHESVDANDQDENHENGLVPEKVKFNTSSFIYVFLIAFGLAFSMFIYIFQVVLTPIKVIGLSMYPTINLSVESNEDENHCDIVYFSKDKHYDNNDIVIIATLNQKYVLDNAVTCIIKRVIATPGQTIRFYLTESATLLQSEYYYDYEVLDLNGNVLDLDKSFIAESTYFTKSDIAAAKAYGYSFYVNIFTSLITPNLNGDYEPYEITISENCYFVMGDNRNNSIDSRYFGVVEYDDIMGSVKIHYQYGKSLFYAIWIKIKSYF